MRQISLTVAKKIQNSSSSPQDASADVKTILIGNKCDLEAERVVPQERGEELARSQGIPFLETSTKTNHNVDEVRTLPGNS